MNTPSVITDPTSWFLSALAGAVLYLFKLFVDLTKDSSEYRERLGKAEGTQEGGEAMREQTLAVVFKAVRMTAEEQVEFAKEIDETEGLRDAGG